MVQKLEHHKERVLQAAVDLSEEDSYQWLTRDRVAARAGMSAASVSNAFGGMVALKREVLREAIRSGNLPIIAEALGARHPIMISECPPALKEAALGRAYETVDPVPRGAYSSGN